jgi:hypothetical protein
VLGGYGGTPVDPLPLRDGRYLRLSMSFYYGADGWTRVAESSFQYQREADPGTNDMWIFRYDYLREPGTGNPHPHSHLQINGHLAVADILPEHRPLSRVHFPTRRMPLEGVIRLLADQFGVPTTELPEHWRPLLTEAETGFLRIAHEGQLGPAE